MTEAPELLEMDDPEGMAIHNATQMDDRDWQTKHAVEDEAAPAIPTGLLEYEAHCAIRNLVRLYGLETTQGLVAGYLNDEADRRPS